MIQPRFVRSPEEQLAYEQRRREQRRESARLRRAANTAEHRAREVGATPQTVNRSEFVTQHASGNVGPMIRLLGPARRSSDSVNAAAAAKVTYNSETL